GDRERAGRIRAHGSARPERRARAHERHRRQARARGARRRHQQAPRALEPARARDRERERGRLPPGHRRPHRRGGTLARLSRVAHHATRAPRPSRGGAHARPDADQDGRRNQSRWGLPPRTAHVKIHDVSLVLRPDMITWPGEPGPTFAPLRRIAKGDAANVSLVTFGDHTGTHVDPPVDCIEGANTVDKLPVDALVGPCRVVGFDGPGHVGGAWLERQGIRAERILFKTRNSARWRDPTAPFTRDFVAIDASAARWCVDHRVKLVGVDYLSIEPQGPEKEGYPVHNTLLRAGVVIIEALDLGAVAPGDYTLVCGAMKLDGTFLDVGCANGLLMETLVEWCAAMRIRIEPYGLDIVPELAALARTRLPQWADRIFVGNALTWSPPLRFDFVRAGLEYV